MKSKVIFDRVSKGDAKKLCSWWNANTDWLHFIDKDNGKLWKLVRYC